MNQRNWEEADQYLKERDYETLRTVAKAHMDAMDRDNDYAFFFFLTNLDLVNEERGAKGLLRSGLSAREAVEVIKELRRLVMRVEWCPEYDVGSVFQYMQTHGCTVAELEWVLESACLDSEYVMRRLQGEPPRVEEERETLPWDDSQEEAVTFVICTNDSREFEEAAFYISRLYFPPGIRADISEIVDAKSICSGYNEGMYASEARYKIYMHHDVRILNRFFLYDLLNIFRGDPKIGYVGMVGNREMTVSGYMWASPQYGSIVEGKVSLTWDFQTEGLLLPYPNREGVRVRSVDGLLIATQYDIPWREDLFHGWHMYDMSQSMEFSRRGYTGFVPYQEKAWCFHDCGLLNMATFKDEQAIFTREYLEYSPEPQQGV